MARLIVKSPYIKCGGSGAVSGYMRYIATRERVELLPDDRPPTRKQEQLIKKLVKDFPDSKKLAEYADWQNAPTKFHASAFISSALEENWSEVSQSEVYMKYIATRPRTERLGTHGLFGDEDTADLDVAMSELENYTGNVWTHIISLKREDAERLGYDNAKAWMNLLRTHRNEIAAAMNIPPSDFRWYAAFHNEGDHPHVHMMAWSVKPGQAYLNQEGIRRIKSELTNDIFKNEMLHLYEQKSASRDGLVRETRSVMRKLVRQMQNSVCNHPEVEQLMQELTIQLESVKGKKSYGYLPKKLKPLVDEIVNQMESLPVVDECYEQWWQLQCQIEDFYSERDRKRPPLSQQKEFRSIKNAIIHEAERIRHGEVSFEDRDIQQKDEPEEFINSSYSYWALRNMIHNEDLSLAERDQAVSELERLAESGDLNAQYLMGKLWRDGPLLTPDSVNARHWFEQAAQQGHALAQYALGKLLLSDDVEVCDPQDGLRWLQTAAENNNSYAAYRLGKECIKGRIVEKNTAAALDWLTMSAEGGNQYAQYMLGKLYLTGEGKASDRERAVYWLAQSAAQGNEYAQFLLDHKDDLHSPSVILSVTRLLYHMSRVFQENTMPPSGAVGGHTESKLMWKIREKRIALGHKEDDHEEQQHVGWNTMT